MSSSDSDDDCYGNISKKLQNMKNNYHEDNIDTANLLNTSIGNNKKFQSAVAPEVSSNSETKAIENFNVIDDDDMILDQIIALNSIQKNLRRGRSASAPKPRGRKSTRGGKAPKRGKNNASIDTSISPTSPTKNNVSSDLNTSSISISDSPIVGQARDKSPVESQASDRSPIRGQARGRRSMRGQRGRARGRAIRSGRGRTRRSWASVFEPIYSVGNTDDYPDLSDDVQLFTTTANTMTKPPEVVDDILDENEELSIKVYWQSSEIIKFMIRKFQKLSQIFEFFSKRENVGLDKLLLTYNDKILKPDDTPDVIGYNIAKFIDGGIVNNRVPILEDTGVEDVNGIKIKFQCQNMKRPLEIVVGQDQRLMQAFTKCAEHMEMPLNKLKFVFDGDCVVGTMTAQDLELEGGECIDVKIIS